MLTKLSMNCNCGTSTVFCAVTTMGTCHRTTNKHANNLVQERHLWNLHSQDHGHLSLDTGAVTNRGGADSAERGDPISTTSTISTGANWADRCRTQTLKGQSVLDCWISGI